MNNIFNNSNKILILGVSGLLGGAVLEILGEKNINNIYGTIRNKDLDNLPVNLKKYQIIKNINAENKEQILNLFNKIKPNIIINCIGKIRLENNSNDLQKTIMVNSLLPHLLSEICSEKGVKLIHISTDGVFSGLKGNYLESDTPDCRDIYGYSKLIGEITNTTNTVTIRTSVIGHHHSRNQNLLNWFLNQTNTVKGYQSSIFSGITTIELAKIIRDYIIPNKNLYGLYHIGSNPIDKYKLLRIISKVYNKNINIIPNNDIVINRSLNFNKFSNLTGYYPSELETQINEMYDFYKLRNYF